MHCQWLGMCLYATTITPWDMNTNQWSWTQTELEGRETTVAQGTQIITLLLYILDFLCPIVDCRVGKSNTHTLFSAWWDRGKVSTWWSCLSSAIDANLTLSMDVAVRALPLCQRPGHMICSSRRDKIEHLRNAHTRCNRGIKMIAQRHSGCQPRDPFRIAQLTSEAFPVLFVIGTTSVQVRKCQRQGSINDKLSKKKRGMPRTSEYSLDRRLAA